MIVAERSGLAAGFARQRSWMNFAASERRGCPKRAKRSAARAASATAISRRRSAGSIASSQRLTSSRFENSTIAAPRPRRSLQWPDWQRHSLGARATA